MRRIRRFVRSAFGSYKNQDETSERLFKEPRFSEIMVALKIIFTLFSEFMALQCYTCYGMNLSRMFGYNWIFQGVMQDGQQDACFNGVEGTNTTDCNDG